MSQGKYFLESQTFQFVVNNILANHMSEFNRKVTLDMLNLTIKPVLMYIDEGTINLYINKTNCLAMFALFIF